MGGNPKTSKWHSTSRDARKRKPLAVTLSAEGMVRLNVLSVRWECSRSQVLDRLLAEADLGIVGSSERPPA